MRSSLHAPNELYVLQLVCGAQYQINVFIGRACVDWRKTRHQQASEVNNSRHNSDSIPSVVRCKHCLREHSSRPSVHCHCTSPNEEIDGATWGSCWLADVHRE